MSSTKDFVEFVLEKLWKGFSAKKMFGEYGLYLDEKVIWFICDDKVFIKISEETRSLEKYPQEQCYPWSKLYYQIPEDEITELDTYILSELAKSIPAKKTKSTK